jgi:hypothetical protein
MDRTCLGCGLSTPRIFCMVAARPCFNGFGGCVVVGLSMGRPVLVDGESWEVDGLNCCGLKLLMLSCVQMNF